MTERCPRTDLLPAQCACPTHRGEPDPVSHPGGPGWLDRSVSWPARFPTALAARFPGRCPDCGGAVEVGDPIVRAERGGYVHEVCPE